CPRRGCGGRIDLTGPRHHRGGTPPHGVRDEARAVDPLPATHDEQVSGFDLARIVPHASDTHRMVATDFPAPGKLARQLVQPKPSSVGAQVCRRTGPLGARRVHVPIIAPAPFGLAGDSGSSTTLTELPLGAGVPGAGACRTTRPHPSTCGTNPAFVI